ncbi:MAG: transposase [candidate division Zixibacteria bacterium]|nr:transposase [candidate division Zixibacteria bacterium]MBU1471918.1 transposase [candidate division Zixibacteria bacterium]MBU2626119.1 transposase [candidate division Zixibacteria bacterium]
MSKLRRFYNDGNVFFVTNVTYERKPILTDNAEILVSAIQRMLGLSNSELIAWVIMPDHFHMIVETGSENISDIMHRIKLSFASTYRKQEHMRGGRVWQHRFWDHVIRDQVDLNRHIDYIHYNPVKHGLATSPFNWKQSSIHKYAREGVYATDWGQLKKLRYVGEFGE